MKTLSCSPRNAGSSLLEVLVAVGIVAILAHGALTSTSSARRLGLFDAQRQVMAQLRVARTNAIASTSHYSVRFVSSTQFRVFPMTSNGTSWQLASKPSNVVTLPSGVFFPSTVVGTTIEFNSRGMVPALTAVRLIQLRDASNQTMSLQVWPSGQVNEL